MAFELSVPHQLDPEDARERLRALGDYLGNKYGLRVAWTADDTTTVSGKYMVVTIDGSMELRSSEVRFSGKDPGMLWRGKAKDYLTGKLRKYLDPQTPVASLPRGP